MKLLILIAAFLAIASAAAAADSTLEVVTNYNLMKQVNRSFFEIDHQLGVMMLPLKFQMHLVRRPEEFLAINDQYRHLLDLVINFNGTSSLSNIENWIYYYRPPSITLNDIKIQIRRAVEYLNPFQRTASLINQHRSNALALPFKEKVKDVEATMVEFIDNCLPLRDHIKEQLTSALFDFRSFLKNDE